MTMLSQVEETTLAELDRLIDWHKQNNKPLEQLTVNQKMYNALQRIANKKLTKELYRRVGELEITQETYRGIKLKLLQKPRKYHRRKDTLDAFK